MDFGLDQIDLKRRMVKVYGEGVIIRVKFTKDALPPPSLVAANSTDHEGVELVVHEGGEKNTDI